MPLSYPELSGDRSEQKKPKISAIPGFETSLPYTRFMAISPHPTQVLIQQFTSGIGLPFQELLKKEIIEEILQEIGVKYKSRIYNPIVIVWSFLSQVLDPDHSCQNAVSRIISYLEFCCV